MSIEYGPAPEKIGAQSEKSKREKREKLQRNVREMATSLNLSAEQLKKLGFENEEKVKTEIERAEQFLDEQIGNLIKKVMISDNPQNESVIFQFNTSYSEPNRIDSQYFKEAFFKRANTTDDAGKLIPRRILEDKQLALSSVSEGKRGGRLNDGGSTWTLRLAKYNPNEEAKAFSYGY